MLNGPIGVVQGRSRTTRSEIVTHNATSGCCSLDGHDPKQLFPWLRLANPAIENFFRALAHHIKVGASCVWSFSIGNQLVWTRLDRPCIILFHKKEGAKMNGKWRRACCMYVAHRDSRAWLDSVFRIYDRTMQCAATKLGR